MDEHSAAVAAYWDAAAASFDDGPDHGLHAGHTRRAWQRRLETWIPGGPADVLDAGCGTGSLSLLLARSGHRVTGVDLAPRMIEQARRKLAAARLRARFLLGDAAAPPTGGERFDAILARHLLWTLPDPPGALRAWAGRLRPGGRLVLVEGLWPQPEQPAVRYAGGAAPLPWHDGIGAADLAAAVRPLAAHVHVEPLSGDADLWGGPVDDERYALVATVPDA
ncbi:class I SAM-dependent methyltransferase [Peterkaempfera griseoplana]|uniref:class I SAM-dependent methyltransferase n=1 Tax=Peterkaempfera griseoplana TaxID=66896 RepID=UPI0006E3A6B1|nr:class I SAM-dependent methyltransferase [Peterkaempfera griseoplana]